MVIKHQMRSLNGLSRVRRLAFNQKRNSQNQGNSVEAQWKDEEKQIWKKEAMDRCGVEFVRGQI